MRALGDPTTVAPGVARLASLGSDLWWGSRPLAWGLAVAATGSVVLGLAFRAEPSAPDDPPAPIRQAVALAPPPTLIEPDDPSQAGLFAGRVVDVEDQPIVGATLYWADRIPEAVLGPIRATSGADGRFRFKAEDATALALDGLPARRQGVLIASASGFGPGWVLTWGRTDGKFGADREPSRNVAPVLTLPRDDRSIRGRVVGPRGQPVAGAKVAVQQIQILHWRTISERRLLRNAVPSSLPFDGETTLRAGLIPGATTRVISDAEGRFRIEGVGRDRFVRLFVQARGLADQTVEASTQPERDVKENADPKRTVPGTECRIQLASGRTIEGQVLEQGTGRPLDDFGVVAGPGDPVFTNDQGRFSIQGFAADPRSVPFLARPRPGSPHFPARGSSSPSGRVLDARGRPLIREFDQGKQQTRATLATADVRRDAALEDPKVGVFPGTVLDAEGRFRVDRLVPGQAYGDVYLKAGRYSTVAFDHLILQPGEVRDLGDIKVDPDRTER